jgi:parallel beta-helix repeat protein
MKALIPILSLLFITTSFAAYNAEIVRTGIPVYMTPGSTVQIEVAVRNKGSNTWYANNSVWLHPPYNAYWGVTKVFVNQTVKYNDTFTFRFTVTAPTAPSQYSMIWQMGRTGQFTFGSAWTGLRSVFFIPSQFIAKLYSEVLGRAPDQDGWQYWVDYFKTNACNTTALETVANAFFSSPDYNSFNYDNEEKIITVYRAILSRDPDQAGFNYWRGELNGGVPLTTLIHACISSGDFSNLLGQMEMGRSYGWGNAGQPLNNLTVTVNTNPIPRVHRFPGGNGAALQTLLDNVPSGDIVLLSRKQMVLLETTLRIPPGVTLQTELNGTTTFSTNRYASFGRLVRNSGTTAFELVSLQSGAQIRNIWLDGQGARFARNHSSVNAHVLGGNLTTVSGCRSSETAGWSNIFCDGPSTVISIENNLITAYNTRHELWYENGSVVSGIADGIGVYCANATVTGNQIIDATDAGIVLFRMDGGVVQNSKIISNTVFNAGNSLYWGISLDQNEVGELHDFAGSEISSNLIWTGPFAHIDVCLDMGTRPLFGSSTDMGVNAKAQFNTSGSQRVNCNMGILVNNLNNSTVTGNTFAFDLVNTTNLPLIPVCVQANNVRPTRNIQSHVKFYNDALIDWHCQGHF